MSSVTRFLRQIPVSTTYYSLPDSLGSLYVLNPGQGNFVGNYPNDSGFMTSAGSFPYVQWLTGQGIYSSNQETETYIPNRSSFILRDMGKTIRAPAGAPTNTAFTGYYREVQIINPGTFPVPPPAGSNVGGSSGVIGGSTVPSTLAQYGTFYIPVTMAGLGGFAPGVYPIAGGQM
jgi:hypothetical protein